LKKLSQYIVLTVLAVGLFSRAQGQDVEMSQYFAAPLHLNPAMAGISYGPRVTANYRNQWSSLGDGFNGGFTTYMAGYDMHIRPIKGGIGVLFTGDQIASNVYSNYKVTLMYSQQIKFKRNFGMRIGLSGSYIHSRLKWDQLTFSDMINPFTGFTIPGNPSANNPTGEGLPGKLQTNTGDMGAGFVIFTGKLYLGFAVNNFLMHKETFYDINEARAKMKFSAHFGGNFNLKHRKDNLYNIFISPNVLFVNQGQAFQVQGTLLAGVSFAYFGVGYRSAIRSSDAVIGYVGFKKGKFRVGYSYDYTINKLINRSGGSHEISFTFNWSGMDDNSLNPKMMKNYIECPEILNF
jgi:type IX secretion system PorP/SprF family membrane protein